MTKLNELETKQPSPRRQLADRIAAKINEWNLNNPFGGDVDLSKTGRPHYVVLFSHPRTLDGLVQVYSEKFITVQWVTGYRFLPHKDSVKFTSETDAVGFIKAAFVDLDEEKANEYLDKASS